MGIPYSKQINTAFDQVTPLVEEGFQVLQTTKNISILLAAIQVLTVAILFLILLVLIAVLITMNPDLEIERQRIVTPVMKWVTCFLMPDCDARKSRWAWLLITTFSIGWPAVWLCYCRLTHVETLSEGYAGDDEEEGSEKAEEGKKEKPKDRKNKNQKASKAKGSEVTAKDD